jgi:hypothetical protein
MINLEFGKTKQSKLLNNNKNTTSIMFVWRVRIFIIFLFGLEEKKKRAII